MIAGTINMEDTVLHFATDGSGSVNLDVADAVTGKSEHLIVDEQKFFKALAIAVHSDGTPDYQADYADAESIMGEIRWIP
jgi:hypothetical protein